MKSKNVVSLLSSMQLKNILKAVWVILIFVGAGCYADRHGVVAAIFQLRDDSPLPSWVLLPHGMPRDQVDVSIVRYDWTESGKWNVRFVVRDKHRWIFSTIQEQTGVEYWHPDSGYERVRARIYPLWIIIVVDGVEEVYEQSEANNFLKIVKRPPKGDKR